MRCCSEIGANFSRLMSSESLRTLQPIERTQLRFYDRYCGSGVCGERRYGNAPDIPVRPKWTEMIRRKERGGSQNRGCHGMRQVVAARTIVRSERLGRSARSLCSASRRWTKKPLTNPSQELGECTLCLQKRLRRHVGGRMRAMEERSDYSQRSLSSKSEAFRAAGSQGLPIAGRAE
jgi:hypothetical protein